MDERRTEMKNEEKAIEFATTYDGRIISFAHLAALQMSEWKDEQALKAFCKFQCPDILSESNRCQHQEFEEPCQSYKLFEKLLKGEE